MNTTDKLTVNTDDTFSIVPSKAFTIDMKKVIDCNDINAKLNAMFSIFSEMKITIQDYAMTDELRKYTKEV